MANGSNATHEDVIGALVEKACNYAMYGTDDMAALDPRMRMDAMFRGLIELRDGLRQFYIGITGDDPWDGDLGWVSVATEAE